MPQPSVSVLNQHHKALAFMYRVTNTALRRQSAGLLTSDDLYKSVFEDAKKAAQTRLAA